MADEIRFGYTTGATLTAKVYNAAGTQQGSDVTMTEAGSTGHYSGDMPGSTADGIYDVFLIESGDIVGTGVIDWNGTAERTRSSLDGKLDTIDTEVGVIDGIVDDILADTADLQANQGNWLTATGFATSANFTTLDGKLDTIDTEVGVIDGIVDDILVDVTLLSIRPY